LEPSFQNILSPLFRKLNITLRRFLTLFNEAMKQDHEVFLQAGLSTTPVRVHSLRVFYKKPPKFSYCLAYTKCTNIDTSMQVAFELFIGIGIYGASGYRVPNGCLETHPVPEAAGNFIDTAEYMHSWLPACCCSP